MRTTEGVAAELALADQRSALGYVCLPAGSNEDELALQTQAQAITAACTQRGVDLDQIVCDVASDRDDELDRPGLRGALERIASGEAGGLVVTGLGRLALSASSLGTLIEWLNRQGARLIAADLGLDTSVPEGRVTARALVAAGALERQKLRERTLQGLAAARQKGAGGRPSVADRPQLRERIRIMRADGMTLQAIADRLNDEGMPTLRGGAEWRPSSVQAAAGYRRPARRQGRLDRLPGARTQSHAPSDGHAAS